MMTYKFWGNPRTWLNRKVEEIGNSIYDGLGDVLVKTLHITARGRNDGLIARYEEMYERAEDYGEQSLAALPERTNKVKIGENIYALLHAVTKEKQLYGKSAKFYDKAAIVRDRIDEESLTRQQHEKFAEISDEIYEKAKQIMHEDEFERFVDSQIGWK